MKNHTGKGMLILGVMLSTILFSVLRMIHALFPLVDIFVEWGWSLLMIIVVSVLIQMVFAGLAVMIIMPVILGSNKWRRWLPEYLRTDKHNVLMGMLSFALFCGLAALISLPMGIFKGDLSVVFSFPDIRPDPDVIGWGYFILALVPGIWEELAFRGLIQSKLRQVFSTKVSIFLSSLFFGLFHFSTLLSQAPFLAVFGVIMAFFFGIGWGHMTVRARSVVPAMISHYLVDALGQIFLHVDSTDPALTTGFFILLSLLFPLGNILLVKMMVKWKGDANEQVIHPHPASP